MATLLKVLNNLADIKSAGGVALRVRTQGALKHSRACNFLRGLTLGGEKLHMLQKYVSILSGAQGLAKKAVDQR